MSNTTPVINDEQVQKMKAWLQSPEGIAKIKELGKGESEYDRMVRRGKEARWWHSVKDIPLG